MKLKDTIKLIIPPIIILLGKQLRRIWLRNINFLSGDYPSWDKALAVSSGYDSGIILEKTKTALLKVKNGEAVYERDSVIFDEVQNVWPVLAGLLWTASRHSGTLNVLDFGGSLGSTYFQNRAFLSHLPQVRWNIIEQPHYVEVGKECFENHQLRFYSDIASCMTDNKPDVLLLSGVLQYLEKPYMILDQVLNLPVDLIIIDRTPFCEGSMDRLCVQTVPPEIYPASYPCWIFSKRAFLSHLKPDWVVTETFESLDKLVGPVEINYQGLFISPRKI